MHNTPPPSETPTEPVLHVDLIEEVRVRGWYRRARESDRLDKLRAALLASVLREIAGY